MWFKTAKNVRTVSAKVHLDLQWRCGQSIWDDHFDMSFCPNCTNQLNFYLFLVNVNLLFLFYVYFI